jgi:hypothetical protein
MHLPLFLSKLSMEVYGPRILPLRLLCVIRLHQYPGRRPDKEPRVSGVRNDNLQPF